MWILAKRRQSLQNKPILARLLSFGENAEGRLRTYALPSVVCQKSLNLPASGFDGFLHLQEKMGNPHVFPLEAVDRVAHVA